MNTNNFTELLMVANIAGYFQRYKEKFYNDKGVCEYSEYILLFLARKYNTKELTITLKTNDMKYFKELLLSNIVKVEENEELKLRFDNNTTTIDKIIDLIQDIGNIEVGKFLGLF